jgi:hypothetical protein
VVVGLLLVAWPLSGASFVARWLLAPEAFDEQRLNGPDAARSSQAPARARSDRRVFYSGHSLSDGLPEEVQRIASSKGGGLNSHFAIESFPGSLIRQRVAKRRGGFLRGDDTYDALVVTERHDLPYAARVEDTTRFLKQMHEELVARDPSAETFFYQVWLEIDFDRPELFVTYERRALVFWECIASAVNAKLAEEGRAGRVRVLPGAAALAELVDRMIAGTVDGAPGGSPRERVQSLFVDRVHPSEIGRYFMGAVHYAALFEASPEGAALPDGVSPALGASLQRLAWQYTSAYAPHAAASSAREMAVCREYAARVMCPLFEAHPRDAEPEHPLRLWRRKRACQAAYGSVAGPESPFH